MTTLPLRIMKNRSATSSDEASATLKDGCFSSLHELVEQSLAQLVMHLLLQVFGVLAEVPEKGQSRSGGCLKDLYRFQGPQSGWLPQLLQYVLVRPESTLR